MERQMAAWIAAQSLFERVSPCCQHAELVVFAISTYTAQQRDGRDAGGVAQGSCKLCKTRHA